jgi:hypothetical protein
MVAVVVLQQTVAVTLVVLVAVDVLIDQVAELRVVLILVAVAAAIQILVVAVAEDQVLL